MKLIIVDNTNLDPSLSPIEDKVFSSISVILMGQHLALRNINTLNTIYKIKSIEIPTDLYFLKNLIHEYFPSIEVTVRKGRVITQKLIDGKSHLLKDSQGIDLLMASSNEPATTSIGIPFNSTVYLNKKNELIIDEIKYPWDFLKTVQKILEGEVTYTRISPRAKISRTSIIEGPCIIEEGVVLDDFCKIKGPVYIGRNSFIEMGSLVRNSILEQNTRIGFNCEIGKSYFAGNDKISHHNVILDTIVGQNVWFGGYPGHCQCFIG